MASTSEQYFVGTVIVCGSNGLLGLYAGGVHRSSQRAPIWQHGRREDANLRLNPRRLTESLKLVLSINLPD